MRNNKTQDQFKVSERNGQLVFVLNSEKIVPENAPVRLASAMLEELDYEKLYSAYSPLGRKSAVDPRVLFKVLVFGYMCGIYSSSKLEEAADTGSISCGFWRMERLRTTAHWPASAQAGAAES